MMLRLTSLLAATILTGCAAPQPDAASGPDAIGMANPASVHCLRQGGRSEIRRDAGGGEYGVCLFADGRQCEEWALFRDNRCQPPSPTAR